jgi:MOSC domain-containing protein YiiM/GNAT superfamily N-acetyltransferase
MGVAMIAATRDPPNQPSRRTIRAMQGARLLHINVSDGGVPKRPVEAARITRDGVEGDRQRATTVHGGPHRAVSILGIEVIRRVAAEGHPIAPGTTGENLTIEGFDVSLLREGTRLSIGDEVVIELSMAADPCRTIRHSFRDLRFGRLGKSAHPADSRMYGRVVAEGTVRAGDPIRLEPPAGTAAEDFLLAHRLERAERSSTLAMWAAARAGAVEVHVVDDGDIAIGAAPDVPGPIFNSGFGFAMLPGLADLALEHFARHDVTGWVWADQAPWEDAVADTRAVYLAAPVTAEDEYRVHDDGISVRELRRDEIGAWADVVVAAAAMEPAVAAAWRALEPHLALDAHSHRFVAERDEAVVGTGLLHTHHGVGWLRAGTVLPAHRGRGIQRRLLATRIDHARRLGCDLVGASADEGSVSVANLEQVGLRAVARRARYRVEAPSA